MKYILIIIIIFPHNLLSQGNTSAYLLPSLGGDFPFSFYENKKALPPYMGSTKSDFTINYGISFLVDVKRKNVFEVGVGMGGIGTGYRYRSQTDSAMGLTYGSGFIGPETRRIWLKYHKRIVRVVIPRSDLQVNNRKLKRFWAIFDVNLLAGFTREDLPRTTALNAGNISIAGGTFTGNHDIVEFEETGAMINYSGYGAQLGVSLQFYNYGKKRLQLAFVYHQGIGKRLKYTISSSINGTPFPDFDMYTRGSMFAFHAAYPILLFETNRE